jgi:glycosyltransferase involved in cell wall biosynthesis
MRYPDTVEYLGPVYGSAKVEFLSTIDALLFPTRYKDESWGIVINEALATGTPVVTFDRGCTRTVVGSDAGLVVPRDGEYVCAAVEQIEHWIARSEAYCSASTAAVDQAAYLHREGNLQLEQFAKQMFEPPST